jgi:hypothetical protein
MLDPDPEIHTSLQFLYYGFILGLSYVIFQKYDDLESK